MTTLTPEREAEIRAIAQRAADSRDREFMHAWDSAIVARDLLAAFDATRAYAAGLEQCVEGLRSGEEVASMREALEESERERLKLHAERDAHARDLALLAEVRGHCELREVLAAMELSRRYCAGIAEQWGRENLEDQAAAWALIVRLLREEG